jgi:molybdopterin-guanine dinucleotide biosynthesis protein A
MGADKSVLRVGGEEQAVRVARALRQVAYPVLAVGWEARTGLEAVDDPRAGPLAAFVAGADALAARGHTGAILLVACDMPFVEPALLAHLAEARGPADAAIPVAGGRDQPLCACYGPRAPEVARRLVRAGVRAMTGLLVELVIRRVPENAWTRFASPHALKDVDTPEELDQAREILDEPE